MTSFRSAVSNLEALRGDYSPSAAISKLQAVEAAERCPTLRTAPSVTPAAAAKILTRYHEILLWMRAHPQTPDLFDAVGKALERFPKRLGSKPDKRLTDSGMARTGFTYAFDFPIARWLAEHHAADVVIAWDTLEDEGPLLKLLPLLVGPADEIALDDPDVTTRDWLRKAASGRPSTRAINDHSVNDGSEFSWLVERLLTLSVTARIRDHLYDTLVLPLTWRRIAFRASRTGAWLNCQHPYCHTDLMRRGPDLRAHIMRPVRGRTLRPREGLALINLAKAVLTSREREMFPISHGNSRDVTRYELERGLTVVLIGTRPERRLLLESLWGFLLLKNGVPVGYGCFSALFGSAEIAANIFETFRGGESALIYAELARVIHAHTGALTFTVMKMQIGGDDNEEAIESGAFWFYDRMGFRHDDPRLAAMVNQERARLAAKKGARSSSALLRRFAKKNLFLDLGRDLGARNPAALGRACYAPISLAMTSASAEKFGANRVLAERAARHSVARAIGALPPEDSLTNDFCLLVAVLKIERWSASERRSIGRVIAARAQSSEREYCRLATAHPRLRREILKLLR